MEKIKDIPVWAFHGAEDEAVPLVIGQSIVDALREAGGEVEFTVYPGVGHDPWSQTYENPELYQWMLRQKK
ncbi:MAG: prolyl oligopeptidase family serine peptidase [Candidatus Promineifilaceae bacterium]